MTHPSDAVDAYLSARYLVGLEQMLLDAVGGYATPALAGVVSVESQRVEQRRHPDGGTSEGYEGTLMVQGIIYRFRCWIYVEATGTRFMTDLSEFSPVGWETRFQFADRGV